MFNQKKRKVFEVKYYLYNTIRLFKNCKKRIKKLDYQLNSYLMYILIRTINDRFISFQK